MRPSLHISAQPPARLLKLERRLAVWRPQAPMDFPPSAVVLGFVRALHEWETEDRRRWERAGCIGDFIPSWQLEVGLRKLWADKSRRN